MTVNKELEGVRIESVVVYFKVTISRYLLAGTEENH
jgi:hypothetical protein